ncbi:copper ion binding protein [Paenibacillus xylaniclasticus]|uniref:copper ion binding protein n=1 Tax=Paenibacillus xylaniclasticus TaxID=588083 RepID=UPI000FD7204F|nr:MULTISPECIES: copper ion binding protein [Paenibacillus]GFN30469.1 copper chaperone CopZ [Paenibacillus curdlanolyticus]
MTNVTLQVNGMSCQHCVNAIEKAIREIGGSAAVDLSHKSVTVEFDESKLTLDAVKAAIEDQGYDVV